MTGPWGKGGKLQAEKLLGEAEDHNYEPIQLEQPLNNQKEGRKPLSQNWEGRDKTRGGSREVSHLSGCISWNLCKFSF